MNELKHWIKYYFSGLIYRRQKSVYAKVNMLNYFEQLEKTPLKIISDASYNVFTYHGEDGIILYLLNQLKDIPSFFVDIGSGDCIKSNCANLAVHFEWNGIFIDNNARQLVIGKRFYKPVIKNDRKIQFIKQLVTTENINQLLVTSGVKEVGLLSIDIDGNDYWIWDAISVIKPRIVVIEAKVEFGYREIVIPYGEHNHPSVNSKFNGASVEALRKLGLSKGYKLVGANKQGYNLFFVPENENIQAVATGDILQDMEIQKSFYPEFFFEGIKFASHHK